MLHFSNIAHHSHLIEENEFFELYHNSDAPYMYDYNCMRLKYQPTLEEFLLIEKIQKEFHQDMGLDHLKFYWPENTGLTKPVTDYLEQQGYGIELLELYAVHPADFIRTRTNPEVQVKMVTEASLQEFMEISKLQDLDIGTTFAEKKQGLYPLNYSDPTIHQVIAYLNGEAVGGMDLIEDQETIEIDNFFVNSTNQGNGIGTELQQFAMDYAGNKTVILVADSDGTPKEMYQKQNYTYLGYQAAAQKE